jgi:hypothetical protein
MHVFNPDHNLFCLDCGQGEIGGDHGIIGIVQGKQIYADSWAAKMYAESEIESPYSGQGRKDVYF